jgi:hypothetical protein
VHKTTFLSFRNPFHSNWNPRIPSNGHSFFFFLSFSLPVQTALRCKHLYLILHSTVNVMVGARGKQAGNVFIDWSCLVNPHHQGCCTQSNPSRLVVGRLVSRDKTSKQTVASESPNCCSCSGVNLFSNGSGEL